MVAMHDRKIKYVAYISRLQSNHLNQGTQMRFREKYLSTLSKFLLKTFNTFTNSENLRFFSISMYKVCDVINERHVRQKKKWNFNLQFFFKKLNNIFNYHAGTTSFYRPCNIISMIGRCMDVEMTLFSYLTHMSEYDVNGPLLKY